MLCIGFLGGFAPAASAAAQAVRTGQLTAEEADALLPACICSGPSFVVLTVGQSLLGSAELGVLLFASQITANYLTAALLNRFAGMHSVKPGSAAPAFPAPPRLDEILADAAITYCKLCGFILFFRMLRQPPRGFYGQPSVYLSGGVMEIEHFRRVRTYEEGRLCLEFAGGLFTVYGDGLRIETLAAHRITLRGRFLRTDFSSS